MENNTRFKLSGIAGMLTIWLLMAFNYNLFLLFNNWFSFCDSYWQVCNGGIVPVFIFSGAVGWIIGSLTYLIIEIIIWRKR